MLTNTAKRGYDITINRGQRILKMRAWGLWDVAFAEQYDHDLQTNVLEISEHGKKPGWLALVDLNDFPPQFPEVQAIIVRGMEFGTRHGLHKEARLIGRGLTDLQLKRLIKEAGMPENSTFQSEHDALAWLLNA